jgi:hypothetical protein
MVSVTDPYGFILGFGLSVVNANIVIVLRHLNYILHVSHNYNFFISWVTSSGFPD